MPLDNYVHLNLIVQIQFILRQFLFCPFVPFLTRFSFKDDRMSIICKGNQQLHVNAVTSLKFIIIVIIIIISSSIIIIIFI